ncbi:zinc-finger domain-containing protein [Novispirillum sp. DQ9]|uniref:zinc-finger domain-containing protein n=1 Tax=Novispirillum sp. DQ9 TaxID=3398612 RepID=UPI003C7D82FF
MPEGATTQVIETIEVETIDVPCDGGQAALGHPRVWLHIEHDTHDVVCPYCSRRYVLKEGASVGGHH